MIYKKALIDSVITTINGNLNSNNLDMVKLASGRVILEPNSEKAKIVEAEIKKHPNALFFRSKSIEADVPNSNGDYFSEEELLKSYKTFEGVPFFTNHDNQNIENARGKIIFAEWVPEEKAVYTIAFVDRDAYPHICRSIEEEYVTGTSMGCFTGDMRVLKSSGIYVPIKDIKQGDIVVTHTGEIKQVLNVQIHEDKTNQNVNIVKIEGLPNKIKVTDEHPFYVLKRQSKCFISGEQLSEFPNNKYMGFKKRIKRWIYQTKRYKDAISDKNFNYYEFEWKKAKDLTTDDMAAFPISKFTMGSSESKKLNEIIKSEKPMMGEYRKSPFRIINGYIVMPIKNITKEFNSEPVYNLEVKDDNSFIVEGVAVHNCSVEYSTCNICGNRAAKTDEYCEHIKNRKGRKFSGKARNVVTGEIKEFKDQLVFEYNHGLKFIELSAVVDPACPSCRIQGVINNTDYLARVANIENSLYMIKTSAIEKHASKEEIDQIEKVLETLEGIAVNLIKNRKQVEMEFASDLVDILSNLQTWLDELVGAGYGNLQGNVPGSEDAPSPTEEPTPAQVPGQPAPTLPPSNTSGVAGAVPAASETPVASGAPTSVTGAPGKPPVQSPKLPIATPKRPKTSEIGNSMAIQRIADDILENGKQVLMKAANLNDKMNKTGVIDMAKRRTLAEKKDQNDKTREILSNSWQEKKDFFEYIKGVPSLQDNENKLSVMKRDDTFIIVAEEKSQSMPHEGEKMIWTYENLTDEQKQLIKASPKEAAEKLLETFAKNLKQQKEGVKRMTDINKNAGATSVNKAPEVVTEKQLDQKGLYHSRTGEEAQQVTQAQLESLRKGEQEVVTEKQLNSNIKLNPRTEIEAEVVTEKQLESVRTGTEADVVTQKQLDENRVNNEKDVVTERQLNDISTPWARAAGRNPETFKSAVQHLDSAIDVMADSAISSGCTPDEICSVAASLVDTTKNRYDFATSILESDKGSEKVNYAKRAAFWNNQNLKVASAGTKEIAKLIVDGLRKVASDKTINPEVLISAVDVIAEGGDAIGSIADKIKEKVASASSEVKVKSIKAELREALKKTPVTIVTTKDQRDTERKEILASVDSESAHMQRESERQVWEKILNKKAVKESSSDIVIETDFEEIGCKKEDPSFKKAIASFTKGALASQNIKVATITNVTISGDTIQIAVQSDEGNEEVEIPVGDQSMPAPEETMPEGDLSGEGLENTMGTEPTPPPAPAPATTASSKKMTKVAQTPPGGAMGGQPGGVAASGAPEQGLPGAAPKGDALQALTTGDEEGQVGEDIPTVGEQQMPWTICPECGKSDVDITNEDGDIKGKCNNPECGAEYEAMIKKEIEFKIVKPSKLMSGEGTAETPEAPAEAPEVPAMPVAAQTRIDKNSIMRIANNKKQFGHVCPACGKTACKASKDEDSHTEFTCEACGTQVQKDILVSASNPDIGFLRVKWDIIPTVKKDCKSCSEKVAKFASRIKVEKMLAEAAAKSDSFPMANCIERIARVYGGNTVGSFGECKGKLLAECACKEMQRLGFTKVRHLQKFAEAAMTKDPMDVCIEDQKKKGHSIKEASSICNCLKKKYASTASENIYALAFGEDVMEGRETLVTARDLNTIYDIQKEAEEVAINKAAAVEADAEIGDALPPLKEATVEVEIVKEATVAEKKPVIEASKSEENCNKCKKCKKTVKDCICGKDNKPDNKPETEDKEVKEAKADIAAALQMNGQRVRKVSEEVVKVAGQPKVVENIEGNVEAGVPRKEQYLGKEKEADSAINKTPAKPNIPRGDAYMGKEKEADSAINKSLNLPDVAVDHGFIGDEARVQSGMPEINNEIKGTVIASKDQVKKEAKQMKEVETIEGDVEAGVPRAPNGGKLGKEKDADSAINTPNKGPDVPTGKAYMGEEATADSLINSNLKGPDVPIDNAYMGHEKDVQKNMPAINDEMLKVVKQQREDQLGKIAKARELKATKVASYLVASKRVSGDMDTFNAVVKALAAFEIDNIETVAEKMFPEKAVKTASTEVKKTVEAGYTLPAIVLESKAESDKDSFLKKLSSAFTIGNKNFDSNLTIYGEK